MQEYNTNYAFMITFLIQQKGGSLKISVSISNHVLRIGRIPLAKHELRLTPAEKHVKGKYVLA